MKRTVFKVLTISLIASFAVFFAACPEEPEKETVLEGWNSPWSDPESDVTINSQVGDDGKVTVTVGGTAETEDDRGKASVSYEYTAQRREAYTYKFEAWTESGSRTLGIQYYDDGDPDNSLQITQPITATQTEYTIIGYPVPESGPALLQFLCADQLGTFYVRIISIEHTPPDGLPAKSRWFKEVVSDSTATLELSVDDEGVCTMTVGGTADSDRYKTQGEYNYTAKANTSYVYKFEAWTDSGSRALTVQWYEAAWGHHGQDGQASITINTTRTTYTCSGANVPWSSTQQFEFYCSNVLGTFYVKVISIEEKEPDGSDDFSYNTTEDDEITIIGYNGSGGDITIPAEINEISVTAIGADAFRSSRSLTGVVIPDSVITIGNYAFYGNPLTSVTIGNSVTTIEYGAFYSTQLTEVTIPDSVTSIGVAAFYSSQLTSVTIGANVTLPAQGSGAFLGDFDTVYSGANGGAGTYTRGNNNDWTKQP